ncbi:MAG: serine/threonine-protein kinase [Planctomycetota bacterium]
MLQIPGYEIKEIIGEGGVGVVYRARQISMNREVAIKVMDSKWAKDPEFRKRFVLEARTIGKLSHQNLIQVYDVGKLKCRFYFSMEYVDGYTVDGLVDIKPMDYALSTDIVLQVTRVLNYITKEGLVHRDIKPSNIMLTKSGTVKVGDFGFVFTRLERKVNVQGYVLGTPEYISPEQAVGKIVDFRSDLYSLGATYYHMVTGRLPYVGSVSSLIEQHSYAELPSPKAIRSDIPDSVCIVVEKLMAKDPSDRYQKFEDLFDDLQRIKEKKPLKSQRVSKGKSMVSQDLSENSGSGVGSSKRDWMKERKELYHKLERYESFFWVGIIVLLGLFLLNILLVFILIIKPYFSY